MEMDVVMIINKKGNIETRLYKKIFLLLIFTVAISLTLNTTISYAEAPYNVPSSIENNWNDLKGSKSHSQRSGRKLIYDVYSKKYINNGYRIVNKNFGKGRQPYLNFRGWSVIFGHKRHTRYNHDTYIVAHKLGTSISKSKVYGTKHIGISATEDLEYNNQGSGVWNECSAGATNKDNERDCNMRYKRVGFNAFIPLEELFPDASKSGEWKLFIVKEVDGHIVYTELILPFDFNNRSYKGGDIDLSSGVNANTLYMNGNGVLRRSYPRESPSSVYYDLGYDRYFTTGRGYNQIDSDESDTAVWYGVRSPHDSNRKKWGASAYWLFGGEQATIKFTPDDKPPVHIADSLWSNMYRNGSDYWTQPNDKVYIRLKQRDRDSGNKFQYLRLNGSGLDVRSRHNFNGSGGNHWDFMTSPHVNISTPNRTQNTDYGAVNWSVIPKTHGHYYNVMYYYRDLANNSIGYNDTGMNLRVDGVAPSNKGSSIWSHLYKNGNDYWTQPNDSVYMRFQQYDGHSGNKQQYFRLLNSNGSIAVRSRHDFYNGSWDINKQVYSSHVSINSAYRDQNSNYGRVRWKVTPKTHGKTYTIQRYYRDNVNNNRGYISNGRLRVDGVAPTTRFSPHSKRWANSNVTVGVNINDSHSGVKRFRYRIQKGGNWGSYSSWHYGDSKNLTLSYEGRNRIHVQSQDNVGNTRNNYSGYYYIDKTDPTSKSDSITGHSYRNGGNYWVKPNQSVNVRLRGYDALSRIYLSYIRLYGSSHARSQHNWNSSSTHLNNYDTSSHITVNSVRETYESSDRRYKETTFNVTPKTHGQYFNVYSLYRDNAYNWSNSYSWNSTGMTIRADGVAPNVDYRNAEDTQNMESRPWSGDDIQVRLKFDDPHSGYKRSRYAWTLSAKKPSASNWSKWKTNASYLVSKRVFGKWYLHVQTEDNVGNKQWTYNGFYKYNEPPNASFIYAPKVPYEPSDYDYEPLNPYEGDNVQITNTSTDPEGHQMTADWVVTNPNGVKSTLDSWDIEPSKVIPGIYTVHLTVTDEYGGVDDVTKSFKVLPLAISGEVKHTERWKEIHEEAGNLSSQFYSGEKFLVSAATIDYPIDEVTVDFSGEQLTGDLLEIHKKLRAEPHPEYFGELFEQSMAEPTTKLVNGKVYFLYTAHFANGIVKRNVVEVEIIDDVIEQLDFYRSN